MQPAGRMRPELRSGTDRRWRSMERMVARARARELAANAHVIRQLQPSSMTTTELVTLPLAVLGAVLGVINTWRGLDRDRVKLRVVPKIALAATPGLDPRPRLCIEVTNLSTFAVTISEVGFLQRGTDHRMALVQPILPDGGPFPRRLEARSGFTAYFAPGAEAREGFANVTKAYARTECGEWRHGKSKALSAFVKARLITPAA
jgi:hypothetical protein